jgi:nickel/cobalt transporter (NiCoT) family protein
MGSLSLFVLVFTLGLRHGLDADHLAYIDGQTRYNIDRNFSRWVGTLFSLGHGGVVVLIAAILGFISQHFTYPAYFDVIGTWVSIIALALIGTLNIISLIKHPKSHTHEHFVLKGFKGKFVPKLLQNTTNPLIIVLVGILFAFAMDTVSQTSVWALASLHNGKFMPLILGFVFLFGMMLTDTLDSFITFKILKTSNGLGKLFSQITGWIVVIISYGVCLYELINTIL